MDSSNLFSLRWNNHTNNILQVFLEQFTSETLVDVTLSCQGRVLKAHKMILSACSPFFRELFQEHEVKHPVVILNEMKYDDIKLILEFMYRGEIKIQESELDELLDAAECLQVKGLTNVRSKYDIGDIKGDQQLQQPVKEEPPEVLESDDGVNDDLFAMVPSSDDVADDDLPAVIKVEAEDDEEQCDWGASELVIDMPEDSGSESFEDKSDSPKQVNEAIEEYGKEFPLDRAPDEDEKTASGKSKRKQKPRKSSIGRIPRPPNAFMIFANEWRSKIASENPAENNKEISVRLGLKWKSLTSDSKECYFNAARKADEEHKQKYPGYCYNPKEARLRKQLNLMARRKAVANLYQQKMEEKRNSKKCVATLDLLKVLETQLFGILDTDDSHELRGFMSNVQQKYGNGDSQDTEQLQHSPNVEQQKEDKDTNLKRAPDGLVLLRRKRQQSPDSSVQVEVDSPDSREGGEGKGANDLESLMHEIDVVEDSGSEVENKSASPKRVNGTRKVDSLSKNTKVHFQAECSSVPGPSQDDSAVSNEPTPKRRRRVNQERQKQDIAKIARPHKPYVVFVHEWHDKLQSQYPGETNKDISNRLGSLWKCLPSDKKRHYYIASQMANEEHKQKHPGYCSSPKEVLSRKKVIIKPQTKSVQSLYQTLTFVAQKKPVDNVNLLQSVGRAAVNQQNS